MNDFDSKSSAHPRVYLRGLDFVTTTALHWQEFPTSRLPDGPDPSE